ncbi:hypothetical protein LXL04_001214 [Taraxacum kok-saghyz]
MGADLYTKAFSHTQKKFLKRLTCHFFYLHISPSNQNYNPAARFLRRLGSRTSATSSSFFLLRQNRVSFLLPPFFFFLLPCAKDLSPEPILFNSTTGYCLLLQSLNLNASVGDLRRNSSSEDETEIQLMNTDSKTGHEATVNSRAQIDDFEAIANVLTRDSSGDDTDIQSKVVFVPFDLSGDDVETQPVDPNQDSKSDSSSGDKKDMKQNEDLKTPQKSSSSSDDGHDGEIQFVKHDSSSGDENSRISKIFAMPNDDVHGAEVHPEDSKPTSGDLSRATTAQGRRKKKNGGSRKETRFWRRRKKEEEVADVLEPKRRKKRAAGL